MLKRLRPYGLDALGLASASLRGLGFVPSLLGAAIGLVNGVLIAVFKLNSLVVTLAVGTIVVGVVDLVSSVNGLGTEGVHQRAESTAPSFPDQKSTLSPTQHRPAPRAVCSCGPGCWPAPRAGGSRPRRPTGTSASRRPSRAAAPRR